jgi:Na+/citrate or Na+/malate symporter
MDKATKTQFSIAFFVLGFIMMILQVLKYLDTIVTGISQYFPIMFYLGLIFMAIGYYLK